jgi:excisionase family DNA binding protein
MMREKEAAPLSASVTQSKELVAALERAVAEAQPFDMIALIGELERLKILLWHRLLTSTAQAAAAPTPDGLDDLRHLSPGQVAELLNVKPAYVHELCRTGRLAAVKEGKYWLIPQAALRERLVYRRSDIDPRSEPRLQSTNLREDIARGPRGRPRRSPTLVRQEGRWRERS